LEIVINKIMNIEKDAQRYRNSIEQLLKEKQNELENTVLDMKISFQEESKNIKNDITHEKLIEAEQKAYSIKKEKEEKLKNINVIYQSNKSKIVDEVFNKIINGV